MNPMEEAKRKYEETEIPQELARRIQMEIRRAEGKRRRIRLWNRGIRGGMAAAAAGMILFTTALNTSTAFAESAGSLPVIGAVARVLTFRSYETKTEDWKISVEIPSVEMISQEFAGLEQSVNEEIYQLCQQYAAEAQARAEEYRQAFLATGGTKEEWEAHKIEIKVWYEVKSQTEDYLSLAVMGSENWTNAYNETRYYNFDLKEGKLTTLEEILGEGYQEKVNAEISRQMEERKKEGAVYFDDFEGVPSDPPFYLNEDGNPVIVFAAYDIAPGSEGAQEFEIKR